MRQGALRVSLVYLCGVLSGSLLSSLLDTHMRLAGASGGVYALLAAHVIHCLLVRRKKTLKTLQSTTHIDSRLIWLAMCVVVACLELAMAIYERYVLPGARYPVSYVAHVSGVTSGLLVGFMLFDRGVERRKRRRFTWWTCFVIYAVFLVTICALHVVWNVWRWRGIN